MNNTSNIHALSSQDIPFFVARTIDSSITTTGTKKALLGHQIPDKKNGTLDGVFVSWNWDGKRLEVRNDRYGIYPLFYSCYAREIRISPAIQHILAGNFPKDLDYPALAVALRLGHFIGDDTPFENIFLLPPASILTWSDGKLNLERDTISSHSSEIKARNFDHAVDLYAQLFSQSISRRRPQNPDFVAPISGGRDSRHILFELIKQNHKPKNTVTVEYRPPSSNEDMRIARMLAKSLELEHVELAMPQCYYSSILKDIELTNFCSVSGHVWALPLAAYLKNKNQILYDGIAGDILSGGAQFSKEKHELVKNKNSEKLADIILGEPKNSNFINANFRKTFSKKVSYSIAKKRLLAELKKYNDSVNPLMSYTFWNNARRGISLLPFGTLSSVPIKYCPYLDHDLFDFFMNLDPLHSIDNKLHDAVIKRAYPQYSQIPFENKKVDQKKGDSYNYYYIKSTKKLLIQLLKDPLSIASNFTRGERVTLIAIRDLLRNRTDGAWYLRFFLYSLTLEQTIQQRGQKIKSDHLY